MASDRTRSGAAPTLINLPPPPAESMTPSDMGPGTPNSTTTTMSELSTVAIKDGHRGHLHHNQNQPLEAERADRISRLAGLERVSQPRTITPLSGGQLPSVPPHGYFDANNQPQIMRERSTVGSASATGSVGGRTTWASGSDVYDPDKMSEDQDVDTSSMGGMSDEANSLVGFGEGARTPAAPQSSVGSPVASRAGIVPSHLREPISASGLGRQNMPPFDGQQQEQGFATEGEGYDTGVMNSAGRTPSIGLADGDPTGGKGRYE